jgi:hypothetical protein
MPFESNPSQAAEPTVTDPQPVANAEPVQQQPTASETTAPPPCTPSDSPVPVPDSDSASPQPEPVPPVGEESVLNDEILVHNAPLLFKTLPVTQYLVLTKLWHGYSISEAASVCHISRVTIYRWFRHDPRFAAAYNQTIEFQQKEANVRMVGMLTEAMDSVNKRVKHGDMKASMFVINHAMKVPRGSLSPKKVAKRMRRRDQRLQEYLNLPENDGKPSGQVPKITSTINEPPAPAALPSVVKGKPVEEKGETAFSTPEVPEAGTA